MSTSGRRPPQNDQELMRDFDARINALEHPGATRVGQWVLSTGDAGDLVASYVGGGSVILSPPPKVGDSPDDTETVQALPSLSLGLTNPQSIPVNTVTGIQWNTVTQSRGSWGIGTEGSNVVEIPEAGQYLLVLNTRWTDRQQNNTISTLKIDTEDVSVEKSPRVTSSHNTIVPALRWLDEGVVIGSWVFTGTANSLGTAARLDIACLTREEGLRSGD